LQKHSDTEASHKIPYRKTSNKCPRRLWEKNF